MDEESGKHSIEKTTKYRKSYFDVLGICCSSEVPLVEKIVQALEGVVSVSVIVATRTVIVVHDEALVSQTEIVKALNGARLEATVRAYGEKKGVRHWPSPYTVACGVLLAISFLKPVYRPLQWLAIGAVAVGLPPILLRSLAAIRRLTLDINILMLIAVGGSIALKDYWEAATIVFLFTIAEWLESRASYKATAVMSSLMSMAPQKAILAATGEVVNASDVEIDTLLAVKAGELIPIDGVVVNGKSDVDQSSLTGESFPVPKQPLSEVWAGTININGYLTVRTTALAENSAVSRMAKLVEEAQKSRSRTQRIIDTCAKFYTPAVVVAAAMVAAIPTAIKADDAKNWLRLSLVLLVSACPCALVLSTPVATFCALAQAAKSGVLVKGGDILEALAKTKVVAFDKTGTVTRGEFTVVEFQAIGEEPPCMQSLLLWVSSIESKSSHPMAAALVDHARSCKVEPSPETVMEFQIYPGEGIYGEIDGRKIYVGNHRIAARAGCGTVPEYEREAKGTTVGYVFSDTFVVGVFSLSDSCRTGAAEAITTLKHMGIQTAMLTGDSRAAANSAQNQVGKKFDMVHAELLPEDKVAIVRDLKSKVGSTVMVGDGINDAPALAAANVGISMGISGSAIAMETSHVALMSNDIRKIPTAIQLGKKTQAKVVQNIVMSVVTKAAIIALAFAGHPLLWAAILSDVGTCLLVIFNSMLLLKSSPRRSKHCCSHPEGEHKHEQEHGHKHEHGHHHHREQCHGHDHVHDQRNDEFSGHSGDKHMSDDSVLPNHKPRCSHSAGEQKHEHGHHHHHHRHHHNRRHHCQEHDHVQNQSNDEFSGHSDDKHVSDDSVSPHHSDCHNGRLNDKAIVCTATCHSHHACSEFRKRPAAACCASSCGGGRDPCCGSGDGGLPQLREIITVQ